jgi:hypothetical protein
VNPKRFGAHDILKPGISRVTLHIYLTLSNPATLFKKSGFRSLPHGRRLALKRTCEFCDQVVNTFRWIHCMINLS